ncbi:MAG: hypothetical protein GX117_13705 [Candidatus Hydrogenedentes bacterium]|nr:hypothetical protein [Candidatus Hydrogenedentota bacterium]
MKYNRRMVVLILLLGLGCGFRAEAISLDEYERGSLEQQKQIDFLLMRGSVEEINAVCSGPGLGAIDTAAGDPTPAEALHVVGSFPPQGRKPSDELIFYFSEAIAPLAASDQLRAAVVLEPNIAGKIYISGNTIRFYSPWLPLLLENPKVSRVSATIHPDLRSVTGKRLAAQERSVVFDESSWLRVEQVLFLNTSKTGVFLSMQWNHPVSSDGLQTALIVRDGDGEELPWSVHSVGDDVSSTWELELPLSAKFPVRFEAPSGLRWGPDQDYISDPVAEKFPSSSFLECTDQYYLPEDSPQLILEFSEPIAIEQLLKTLEVKDLSDGSAVALRFLRAVENRYEFDFKLGEGVAAPEQIALRLPKTLASSKGSTILGSDEELRIPDTVGDGGFREEPSGVTELRADFWYWDRGSVDGYILPLNFSEPVSAEALSNHLRVSPPVENLRVEAGSYPSQMYVKGDWRSQTDYVLHFSAGLSSVNGKAQLNEDAHMTIQPTPFESGAELDSPGLYYFLRKEALPPKVKGRNLDEVNVGLARVFPNNLPVFVRDFWNYREDGSLISNYAEELGSMKIKLPQGQDKMVEEEVNLESLMPKDKRGVFMMTVDPVYNWRNGQRLLVYTDMGVLSHWNDESLIVFVHDLFTLAPVSGAQVSIYSKKLQLLATINTDEKGIAESQKFDKKLGEPSLLVIETADDCTFLDLQEKASLRTPFTQQMPFFDPEGYDGYIYLDRNLYRPGEPVHMRWIVRTNYVDALPNVPLQLRVANPQGRWIHESPILLSEWGTGHMDFQTAKNFPTGKYRVELSVPESDTSLGSAIFNLEEFVPNRMRAKAVFNQERISVGETAMLSVTAEHLFGGAASGRKTEGRVFLNPIRYESAQWPGYIFGNEDSLEEHLFLLGESESDGQGYSEFEYQFKPTEDITMPVEVVGSGRVLELGGRAVTDMTKILGIPDTIMVGVAAVPMESQESLQVHVLALDSDETPVPLDTLTVTLERREWNYYLRRFSDHNEPRWDAVYQPVQEFTVPLEEGQGTLTLPYPSYGEYRLRVHSKLTQMYSTLLFNRWWNRLSLESQARPELIRLTLNQELYQAGDSLELRIESPYDGVAYIVAQGDHLHTCWTVPVVEGEAKTDIVVPQAWFPNTWLQVTVVRNAEDKAVSHYPYSSFTMIDVPLDDPTRRIETVFVDVPEQMLPSQNLEFTITTKDNGGNPIAAEITVAAVDEGIHSILGYDNPDPYSYFQRSRKMEVQQAHYYDKVFYDTTSSAEGGDMMRRLGISSQVDENWIRPVALWTGTVRTDASGRAALSLKVPEFTGQLRLVAVSANGSAVGAADSTVFVKRPYMLRSSMPRFALAGDRFECTAVAMNLTDTEVTALVRWEASASLSGSGEEKLSLAPGAEAMFRAPIQAAEVSGQGHLLWTMTVTDLQGKVLDNLVEEAPLPVRPPAAYETQTQLTAIMPGEMARFANEQFQVDPGLYTRVEITSDPILQARPALKYLLQYPYGCSEQIVSQAMPLYLLKNYARLYEEPFVGDLDSTQLGHAVDRYIMDAVESLLSRQLTGGGISFWPGEVQQDPYVSVYALHFLTFLQRDHAVPINRGSFENLQAYAARLMKDDRGDITSNFYLRAYACYVLALGGNLEAIEYVSRFDGIPMWKSARYLLAAARALHSSTPRAALKELEEARVYKDSGRSGSGTLNSPIRDAAIRLISLLHMDAPEEYYPELLAPLASYLGNKKGYTTQESAFAVTALGMFLERDHFDPDTASIRIVDADGERTVSAGDIFTKVVEGKSAQYEIHNEGGSPAYVYLERAGIPLMPSREPVESELSLSRRFYDEDGTPHLDSNFNHGSQYLVELSINPESSTENLLITDLLPAGFEVANPRLEVDKLLAEQQAQDDDSNGAVIVKGSNARVIVTPDFLEVRDDRLALALNQVQGDRYIFRYLVRAVTPGRFTYPALHGEGMYSPSVRASTVPTEITIQ